MRTDSWIRVLVILLLVLACEADQSYTGKRSWDLILSEEELGATLDRNISIDFDFTSGQCVRLGGGGSNEIDSSSKWIFVKPISNSENLQFDLNIEVYNNTIAARRRMESDSITHFRPTTGSPPRTNPFLSATIDVQEFGDQSYCYQWSRYAPMIVFREGHIVAQVQVYITIPSLNRGIYNDDTLIIALALAEEQLEKIQRELN